VMIYCGGEPLSTPGCAFSTPALASTTSGKALRLKTFESLEN
jgi:hypothetical protein